LPHDESAALCKSIPSLAPAGQEAANSQRQGSGTDVVDRFLSGLAPGDPGYEQAEPERLSQTHFLQQSRSFNWDEEAATGGAPSTPTNVVSTSQGIDSPLPPADSSRGGGLAVEECEEQNRVAEAALEMTGPSLLFPMPSTQLSDELPCTQVCGDLTQVYPDTQLSKEDQPQPEETITLQSSGASRPAATEELQKLAVGEGAVAEVLASELEASTVTPVRPMRWPRKRGDEDSVAKGSKTQGAKSTGAAGKRKSASAASALGHTLSPLQQGLRVAVLGDGWGSREGGYEAVVTEADHYTFTVIATSGKSLWAENHVLKEHCIFLAEDSSQSKGQSPSINKRRCGC